MRWVHKYAISPLDDDTIANENFAGRKVRPSENSGVLNRQDRSPVDSFFGSSAEVRTG